MSQPGDTFFDFFDEEPAPPGRAGLRRRLPGRRGGGRPTPPRPLAPLMRLVVLVVFILFLLLVFGLLIDSCSGESRHSADASYMNEVATLAQQSSSDGTRAFGVLTTPGLTVAAMAKRLDSLAGAEQQNLSSAQSISPPGRLRSENGELVEALELRVSGLHGLATVLAASASGTTSRPAESRSLAQQSSQLLASDIVWDDLFLAPAQAQLRDDGVGGVTVPESHFFSTQDLSLFVTPDEMSVVLNRILAAAAPSGTCSGLHGTGLVSVQALPSGASSTPQTLQPAPKLNYVNTTQNLLFRVTIEDTGDFQEVGVEVQLTLGKSGAPITRTGVVPVIDRGQQAYVDLGNLGDAPFGTPTSLEVNVKPVCGETDLTDNSAQYKVYFELP